jgi:hypothetical protein
VEESFVLDGVICLGEVDVDSEEWLLGGFVLVNFVEDGLECGCGAGVWSECILRRSNDVIVGEVGHHLVVDEGIKQLGYDREQ